jgi:AcrR family transcriptional regulator
MGMPRGQTPGADAGLAQRGNRGAIVQAAAGAIARRGVRGMRVEEVAAEAGVSPALLYYHFENRAGLVRAALEHASERAPSTALRERRTDGDGYERLEAALLGELDDEAEVREAAVVWGEISASAVFEPELRDDVRRVSDEWQAAVSAGIRAGLDDHSIRPEVDPNEAADTLISLVDGLCTRWLSGAIDRERARRLLRDALRHSLQQTA